MSKVLFQRVINILKLLMNCFIFFPTKLSKFRVYFILTACVSLDQPHFKCSGASCGYGYHIGQLRHRDPV